VGVFSLHFREPYEFKAGKNLSHKLAIAVRDKIKERKAFL
jgi:hypothetical protein